MGLDMLIDSSRRTRAARLTVFAGLVLTAVGLSQAVGGIITMKRRKRLSLLS